MTPFQRRIFILLDEWFGVVLCCWTYERHRKAFPYVLVVFVILVYFLSYVPFWLKHDRWWK